MNLRTRLHELADKAALNTNRLAEEVEYVADTLTAKKQIRAVVQSETEVEDRHNDSLAKFRQRMVRFSLHPDHGIPNPATEDRIRIRTGAEIGPNTRAWEVWPIHSFINENHALTTAVCRRRTRVEMRHTEHEIER